MDPRIETVVAALKKLGADVEAGGAPYAGVSMSRQFGWNCPPLLPRQLAVVALNLAEKISDVPDENLGSKFSPDSIVTAIDDFTSNTLPYIWNGNATGAVPNYFALIHWIDSLFELVYESTPDWEKLLEGGYLPKKISAKLRGYNATIKNFDKDFGALGEKIAYINQAHDAAEALPTDLDTLRSVNEDAAEAKKATEKSKILAEQAFSEIEKVLEAVRASEAEARKLVENTEDAYSAATTRGLGEAFQKRAEKLSNSMWIWVAGLMIALFLGAVTGHVRVNSLQELLSKQATSGAISLNIILALLSVAAPIWFAWIATKQIGHRFRLSEDYAFKASVAQAYEGYRREAARVDPEFAKRLFGSALDRLDEPPIRFVENETFGSPWHEFVRLRQQKSNSMLENPQKPTLVPQSAEAE